MNLQSWLEEMQGTLETLDGREHPGEKRVNVILPPSDPALMDEIEQQLETKFPRQLREFYSVCGGIHFYDVGPGYYLTTLEFILRTREQLVPLKIEGEHAGSILTIGDNGHEDYFAIRTDGREEVLLLPESLVEESIYYEQYIPEQIPVQVVASDFNAFLKRLLADTQATLRNEENWPYMTTWEE